MPGFGSIDGLVSGLNTTEIVDSIIKFERRNAVLLEQEQAEKTNIISAYKALQAKFLALNTELAKLTASASWEAASINVSDDSVLRAAATGRVNPGAYDLRVLSLARNHQLASQGFSDRAQNLLGTGSSSIQVGDGSAHVVTVDGGNNSLAGIRDAINDAGAGVTASIINDGSAANPYRLVLTSDNTGLNGKITISSNLAGGANLNYGSASFDAPEMLLADPATSAAISLGTTASFTGSANKIYTFTVEGSGSKAVGGEPITINWTDGTNSGSVVVMQADSEVELVGEGADGLKLNFSAGELTGGDTFQVSTFAPVLQEASDARISIGAQGGGGSPIVVTSETNTFTEVIGGLTLRVARQTPPGESVTITTDQDIDGIKAKIQDFIKRYNEVVGFIDDQNTYHQETEESGVLFGDSTLWMVRNSLSNAIGDRVKGLDSEFNQLYSIGIRTKLDGRLAITDSTRLEEALRNNLDEVIKLMSSAGSSSSTGIEFVSSTADTVAGSDYDVNITQVATKGHLQGQVLNDPLTSPLEITSNNNTLKLSVDGIQSRELYLAARTYTSAAQLVDEIQSKIDADENLAGRGVTVEWVEADGGGYLKFTSGSYGSKSTVGTITSVSNSAYAALGLLSTNQVNGLDVAGTINGEVADGSGQLLKGADDSETIKGLVLRVTMGSDQVGDGLEGSVTITKGVASRMKDLVESLTKSAEGTFDRRVAAYENQVTNIEERIAEIDERLALRRERLLLQFYEMETALGEMNSISDFLDSQIAGLNSNWNFGKRSSNS